MRRSVSSLGFGSLVVAMAFVAGCGKAPEPTPAASAPAPAAVKKLELKGVAGYPVARAPLQPAKLAALETSAASRYGGPRRDPFSLTDAERKYDAAQAAERLLSSTGGWVDDHEEPEDKDAKVVYEPQPPRRLMGVVVGDAVYAVIDMGDGKGQIIHPGMKVPNTEWYVVSIDEEKAVLRRDGSTFPKEIVVRLQGSSPLFGGGGGARNNGAGTGAGNRGGVGAGDDN